MDQSQWQILQQMLQQRDAARQGGAGIPGMAGTPGGPVRESPLMQMERGMQKAPYIASNAAAMLGAGTFNGPLAAGGALGHLLTRDLYDNANEPNIRDVALNQLRMMQQGN